MENLLMVNDVAFPNTDMNIDVTYSDKVNNYESESGEKTVEIIRQKICNISVKYEGLLEERIKTLCAAIQTVNEVKFYDPLSGEVVSKTMKADTNRIAVSKVCFKDGVKAWSLSLKLEEM